MSFQIKFKGGEAGVLDSQTKTFLDGLPKKKGSPMSELSPEEIRSAPSPTAAYQPDPAPVAVEEIAVPARDGHQIRVRIYRKDENTIAPPLIFIHGGCWVFCSLDSHDPLARQLCYESGLTVFSIDYRLAPESKYPTAPNDCYDAALWISKNNDNVNVTTDDLLICGDSAGGNLSTVTTLMAKRSGEFKVRGQMLFYPITDASRMDNESYTQFATGHFLTKETMEYGAGHYTSGAEDRINPLVSPLLADDLAGMPKTLIQTAEFDVLRDEAEAYAEKLTEAGVDVECVRYNGTIHAYAALIGKIDLGKEAVSDAATFLKSFNP
ncbi:MAG: alpha/beta hydrolase [Lentisphaeraceae bacterium]|nr:alpha/beta hydrolase [Lentisphaeraceae bacterium]